ncbi:histidine phosphatase family protein [Thioalkalivibrio denitrificans]
MTQMRTTPLLVTVALAGMLVMGLATTPAFAKDSLWAALAEGGKVVMVRHTESEEAEPERSLHLAHGDCSEEQNLSEEGRAQARALADAIRQHGVQVAEALTGEFCRTTETAELVFGGAETWNALNLLNVLPADEVDFLLEDVRDRIGDFRGPGNLFMVTHRPNINMLTFQNVEAGSLVILQPDGTGGFDVVGEIPLESYY